MKPARGNIAEAVAREAAGWLGTPYRHQASRKGVGCDCLGLVRGVWRALYGEEPEAPGPYSMDWAEAGGSDRLLEAASRHFIPARMPGPGRLILFRWRPHLPAKHAAICIGAERFIHAYEGHGVVESALVPQWRKRIAGVFDFPENPED
ncbi:NlpC/P60 family protein [Nitratireductor thuwali]|uniref:Murein DD-endopeptidase MepS/Murein LD-carboxypeptidase n=1 Tax=Nitratireductor thuwali TaxID=2267699 RepID=A0ABY5MPB8_9HYPH|nr:Murein DD-endopeptidase MepS/Murein LD-carboxypeptidase [Nitratireductor thuwali]